MLCKFHSCSIVRKNVPCQKYSISYRSNATFVISLVLISIVSYCSWVFLKVHFALFRARLTPVVTEEKVFLPSADELRAAEMEQALEVGSLLIHIFFYLCNYNTWALLDTSLITRWKVPSEPLVCEICSPMTMIRGREEAAVKSGRKWMAPNLSARLVIYLC